MSADAPGPRRLLLVGMMGAGKSTVGRLLAERLAWRYLDSDTEVERATGRSVPEIFAADGEAAFRKAETQALEEALAAPESCVVSVAGGAVLDPQNRDLIRTAGPVVWLRATVETLAERVGDGKGRPLLAGDPLGTLRTLDAVRRDLYAQVATVVVDVDGLASGAVADQVLALIGITP